MPADFAIGPATTAQPTAPARSSASGTATNSFATSHSPTLGASGPPPVNPGLHLDPALNLVVLQFYNKNGDVTQSYPSQKQLDAYRHDAGLNPSDPSLNGTTPV